MTSNQIAYATLSETQRHNVEDEDIRREQNRINALRADNDAAYQAKSNDIQERYNQKSLEIQQSQGDAKIELEKELNSIKREQQELDQWYKSEMVPVYQGELEVKQRTQLETERYQKRLNELGYDKNQIEWYNAFVNEKWNEYQKYSIDLTHSEALMNQQILRERNLKQYEVDMLRTEQINQQMILDAQYKAAQLELEQKKTNLGALSTFINAVNNATNAAVKLR